MLDSYFVYADMGYDGGVISQFPSFDEANEDYNNCLAHMGDNETYIGAAIIKGHVLANTNIKELK